MMAPMAMIGTLFSVVGTVFSAFAQAQAAEQEAAFARQNAAIARDQAQADADKAQRDSRRRLGSIVAAYGAAGFMPAGTPLDVFADQALEDELQQKTIIYRGEIEAIGHEQRAILAEQKAKNFTTAGILGAFSQGVKGFTGGGGAGYALA